MPTAIAALPPATQPIPGGPIDRAAPDVPEVGFNELWQDKKEGLSFEDFLDIINPLQHIPVVSNVYRMITGDEIGVGARLAGGALFGGPLGLLGAGVVAAVESISGDTIEKQVASAWKGLTGDDDASQIAQAQPVAQKLAAAQPEMPITTVPLASDGGIAAAPPVAPAAQIAAAAPATTTTEAVAPPVAATHLPPSRIYIQGPARLAAASAATAPTPGTNSPPGAEAAAERQRIAQSIQQAQRAQAGLLLANLAADSSPSKPEKSEDDARAVASQPQPFRAHPYLLPPGAPPEMINRAMAQALDRYEAILKQRTAASSSAAPRAISTPVQ